MDPGILPGLAERDICERCHVYPAVPGSRECLTCARESPVDEEGI